MITHFCPLYILQLLKAAAGAYVVSGFNLRYVHKKATDENIRGEKAIFH
jgi:hypothetical protein